MPVWANTPKKASSLSLCPGMRHLNPYHPGGAERGKSDTATGALRTTSFAFLPMPSPHFPLSCHSSALFPVGIRSLTSLSGARGLPTPRCRPLPAEPSRSAARGSFQNSPGPLLPELSSTPALRATPGAGSEPSMAHSRPLRGGLLPAAQPTIPKRKKHPKRRRNLTKRRGPSPCFLCKI